MKTFIKNVLAWLLGQEKKCASQEVKAPPVKQTLSSQPKQPRKVVKKPVVATKKKIKKTIK
jgi:hypothetical protein